MSTQYMLELLRDWNGYHSVDEMLRAICVAEHRRLVASALGMKNAGPGPSHTRKKALEVPFGIAALRSSPDGATSTPDWQLPFVCGVCGARFIGPIHLLHHWHDTGHRKAAKKVETEEPVPDLLEYRLEVFQ